MEENFKITINDILKAKDEVPAEDYYSLAEGIYDEFDANAFRKGQGYASLEYPAFDEKLEGLEEGLYLFAGESNSGKTATMTNMIWAYSMNPVNKLYGVYYSLDDNVNEVIARLIAMNQSIPISVAGKPTRYIDFIEANKDSTDPVALNLCDTYREYLSRRSEGLKQLREANRQFLIIDRSTVQDFDQLMDHARKVQQYVRSFDPEANIIIAIDSLADVTVTGKYATERERIDHIVVSLKHFCNNDIKCPCFASYHLRKVNHNGRPVMDDVKESGKIGYEASCVFLIFNEVSKLKQGASVYLSVEEDSEKHPVIEIDWAKNKKSSFKGRTYYAFEPNFSKLVECPRETMQRFDTLIYTK